MQLNQRDIEADLQKDQRNVDETLRVSRRDIPTWQISHRDIDVG
jgi:hypothetical protein